MKRVQLTESQLYSLIFNALNESFYGDEENTNGWPSRMKKHWRDDDEEESSLMIGYGGIPDKVRRVLKFIKEHYNDRLEHRVNNYRLFFGFGSIYAPIDYYSQFAYDIRGYGMSTSRRMGNGNYASFSLKDNDLVNYLIWLLHTDGDLVVNR